MSFNMAQDFNTVELMKQDYLPLPSSDDQSKGAQKVRKVIIIIIIIVIFFFFSLYRKSLDVTKKVSREKRCSKFLLNSFKVFFSTMV